MAEELKELIDKIQEEGVKAAEDKASQIQDAANQKAQAIINQAKAQAEKIIRDAEAKTRELKNTTNALLNQTARDLLLSLKKEITSTLDKLIALHSRQALTPEELVKILTALIKDYSKKDKGEVVVYLNKEDLKNLEKGLFSELDAELKKGIILKPSQDVLGGFIISYDSGKSHYDFTDKALAEYIGNYLKPKLQDLMKAAVSTKAEK